MGSNALNLQSMCLAKLQGISSLCVCIVCVLGITVLYVLNLMLSWKEPVTFLFVLKMKTNIHQKTIPSSLLKRGWVTLVLSSFNQLNFISIRLKVYALSVFLFLAKTTQPWLLRYGTLLCYRILSCCIFYAIPFLMTPGGRGVLCSIPLIALLCGGGEGYQRWVCLFSLPSCLTQFSCSPLVCNCLHLFCQPTCTKCKKEFLNR